jgi:hypothetical protein
VVAFAERRHRPDLAAVFIARPDRGSAESVTRAIEALRLLPLPKPKPNMTDPVSVWLPPRIAAALEVNGIRVIVLLVRSLAVGIEKGQ